MATLKNIYQGALRTLVKKLERRIARFYEELIDISFQLREDSFKSQVKYIFCQLFLTVLIPCFVNNLRIWRIDHTHTTHDYKQFY